MNQYNNVQNIQYALTIFQQSYNFMPIVLHLRTPVMSNVKLLLLIVNVYEIILNFNKCYICLPITPYNYRSGQAFCHVTKMLQNYPPNICHRQFITIIPVQPPYATY